jgi:hypothetical protein
VNVDGIPPEHIAVLSMCSTEKSIITGFVGESFTAVGADGVDEPDAVVWDSVWRFKGLERRVIILTDVSKFLGNRELLYVAMSRARTLLIIVTNPETIPKLQAWVQGAKGNS